MIKIGRSKVQLKKEIIDALKEFPMTTHGVSRYVNCHYNTAKKRLEELEKDGVVEKNKDKWQSL